MYLKFANVAWSYRPLVHCTRNNDRVSHRAITEFVSSSDHGFSDFPSYWTATSKTRLIVKTRIIMSMNCTVQYKHCKLAIHLILPSPFAYCTYISKLSLCTILRSLHILPITAYFLSVANSQRICGKCCKHNALPLLYSAEKLQVLLVGVPCLLPVLFYIRGGKWAGA